VLRREYRSLRTTIRTVSETHTNCERRPYYSILLQKSFKPGCYCPGDQGVEGARARQQEGEVHQA